MKTPLRSLASPSVRPGTGAILGDGGPHGKWACRLFAVFYTGATAAIGLVLVYVAISLALY